MPEAVLELAVLVMLVGTVIVLSLLTKAGLERVKLPPLVGYLVLGFLLRAAAETFHALPETAEAVFEFLAKLGVIALLFGVGLQSKLRELLAALRYASPIWLGNIIISGGIGFAAAYWLLDAGLITGIILGTALTATSVGVPSAVWDRAGALQTGTGELFVDVAEMDDVSGVVLMAMLFAVLPTLASTLRPGDATATQPAPARATTRTGQEATGAAAAATAPPATGPAGQDPWSQLGRTASIIILKLVGFTALCLFFARYISGGLVRLAERIEGTPDAVISLTAVGIILAGIAGVLGFSVAIGAFFAGLAFSRRREHVLVKTPYQTLRNLVVPFFFIGIGLNTTPSTLMPALGSAAILLLVAVVGKLVGTIGPALLVTGVTGATVLGVSMVPRAEITMIIMDRGLQLGDWAVTPTIFSAMVLVAATTSLLAPPVLRRLIERWIQPSPEQVGR